MRNPTRCQEQKHPPVVPVGAVGINSRFDQLVSRVGIWNVERSLQRGGQMLDDSLVKVEQARFRTQPLRSLHQIAEVYPLSRERVAIFCADQIWRVNEHKEIDLLTNGPELRCNFVGEHTAETEAAEDIGAGGLSGLNLCGETRGNALEGCVFAKRLDIIGSKRDGEKGLIIADDSGQVGVEIVHPEDSGAGTRTPQREHAGRQGILSCGAPLGQFGLAANGGVAIELGNCDFTSKFGCDVFAQSSCSFRVAANRVEVVVKTHFLQTEEVLPDVGEARLIENSADQDCKIPDSGCFEQLMNS